ncbi:hypothetical protein F5H01DRAFT_329326 [Linnemannia elongata]|nr:hypothetical protein F5H01DRAFT_329326 [Linnemannia elongata]
MLRLRRVLLQDAAEYLHRYPDITLSPLLEKYPEVFEGPMFEAFKEDVTKSLKRLETDVPTDLPPNLMVALQAWNLAQTNGIGDIRRALADIHVRLDAFEECFTTQHDQNNWVNDGLDGIEKMNREIQKALDRPPPVGLQPYFAGVHPFFSHGITGPFSSPPFQHQQIRQSTAHPGSQRLPSPKPGNHQPQAIQPALSTPQAPQTPTPTHTTRRSRPPRSLPASFRRQKESEAVQRPKNSEAGDLAASTDIPTAPVQAKDWFVPTNFPNNTKAIFEELERYDNLRTERRIQGLPTTLSGAATKNLNNKRRIQEQVLFLVEKDRKDNKSSKEDALITAFREIDAVALPVLNRKNRYNFYPCVEYCKRQKQAREGEGREKASKGKEKKQDDEVEQDEDGEEEE